MYGSVDLGALGATWSTKQINDLGSQLPDVELRKSYWQCVAAKQQQLKLSWDKLPSAEARRCFDAEVAKLAVPEQTGGVPRWVWYAGAAAVAVFVIRGIAR